MSDDLGIPEFLKIPAERRKQGWANYKGQTVAKYVEDHGPGSVCRRAGLPDGIAPDVVERAKFSAEVKAAVADARHYAWIDKVRAEKAETDAVREKARTAHKAARKKVRRRR